jgi:hypothetical protein
MPLWWSVVTRIQQQSDTPKLCWPSTAELSADHMISNRAWQPTSFWTTAADFGQLKSVAWSMTTIRHMRKF